MKIALLGDGSLAHVRRYGEYFSGRGHQVILFTFEEVAETGFPVIKLKKYLPTNLLGYLSSLSRLKSELGEFEPDIVNSLYISGYGLLGALSGFSPLVLSALGSDLLVDYRKHPVHRMQIEYAVKRAGLITVDSESLIEPAVEAGADRGRILKAYFGIERELFFPPAESGQKGKLQIISTRNLYRIYNVDLLIDAAAAIVAGIDASFVICGDGPESDRLKKRVQELNLSGRFSFEGRLPPEALADKLRESDIYVSTSTSDSTSVSLLEAMACGAYPVVTSIAANREWIENGINGTVLERDEPEELARAVIEAGPDRSYLEEAAARNSRIIDERAVWEDNMAKVEKRMQALLENEKGR